MKNKRRLRKFLEALITATLWGTCIFIGVVVAKRIFRAVGFAHQSSEIPFVFSSLALYIEIPLGIVLAFVLWRYFNLVQYHKGSRRSNLAFHEKPLWLYGLNKKSLLELQNTKNQTVIFDKKTSLIYLTSGEERFRKEENYQAK